MIIGNASIDYGYQPPLLTFQHAPATPEPFETGLRNRLFDIMEEWEIQADNHAHPALQNTIREMIDQIDNAMHPAEEED